MRHCGLRGCDRRVAVHDLEPTGHRHRPEPVPDDVVSVILGRAEAVPAQTPSTMPAAAVVCRCNGVSKGDLVAAWTDGARDRDALAESTRAGTGCGGCSAAVEGICGWLAAAG